MENVNIITSQNVLIRQNIASVGERMLATFIDLAIMLAYILAISYLVNFALGGDDRVMQLLFLPLMFYSLISEIALQGQSLGKKVLKIKVVKTDGSQPTVFNYFIRWIFRLIDIFLLNGAVALVTIIINGKGQRFGDIAAKTVVVSLKDKSNLSRTIYVDLPDTYEVKYEAVNLLSERDIKTIYEVLTHYQNNIGQAQSADLIRQTVMMVEKKTGLVNDTYPVQFLKTIIYDFNSLHKRPKAEINL